MSTTFLGPSFPSVNGIPGADLTIDSGYQTFQHKPGLTGWDLNLYTQIS